MLECLVFNEFREQMQTDKSEPDPKTLKNPRTRRQSNPIFTCHWVYYIDTDMFWGQGKRQHLKS